MARRNKEITGPFREGAEILSKLFGDQSNRGVELKSDVSHSTVGMMRKGGRGDSQSAVLIARAFRINPNRLLAAFGHRVIPELDLLEWENDAKYFDTPRRRGPASDYVAHVPGAEAAGERDTGNAGQPGQPGQTAILLLRFGIQEPDGSVRQMEIDEMTPTMRRRLAEMIGGGEGEGAPPGSPEV